MTYRPETVERKFWERVDKSDGCWLWTGTTVQGYGRVMRDGAIIPVHRLVYEKLVGPIPEGMVIDHLCRVHNCVRPEHLDPVPNVVNLRRGEGGERTRARWASRTHCEKGHRYEDVGKSTSRGCRECKRARDREHQRRRYYRMKEARNG